MVIKSLRKPKEILPICEGIRKSRYCNDSRDTDRRCKNRASYEINGEYLCAKHAGPKAIEILLKRKRGSK